MDGYDHWAEPCAHRYLFRVWLRVHSYDIKMLAGLVSLALLRVLCTFAFTALFV